ncbi:MAG: hypothetical protein ACJ754_05125 [Pyrinomonadaceae bacterium]
MEARMTYDKQKYAEDGFTHRSQNCSWDCWSWGAILGIGGGIVAVVVGSVLTAVAWFERAGSYAGTVGTILLFAVIPLLIVGALSLDVEERKRKREREARCHEDR